MNIIFVCYIHVCICVLSRVFNENEPQIGLPWEVKRGIRNAPAGLLSGPHAMRRWSPPCFSLSPPSVSSAFPCLHLVRPFSALPCGPAASGLAWRPPTHTDRQTATIHLVL